jgi:glutamine synthetase
MRKGGAPEHQEHEGARVLAEVERRGIRFINLEFTDISGMAKCVTIPAEQLPDALAHGKWFDGSAIESLARVAETDMYLRPDPATFAHVPSNSLPASPTEASLTGTPSLARLICDVLLPTGERFEGDPRASLIAAIEHARRVGYRYELAPELEFFLLREDARENAMREPLPHDRGGYFDLSTDLAADVRREIAVELEGMGIQIESSHHEVAAGQHELDFAPLDALAAADAVITARYVIKAVAQRHGLWATFLPKPFFGVNGSGMHTHQRLLRVDESANQSANHSMDAGASAFTDAADTEYGLSDIARHFIAGQLAHAAGMCALLSPLINSYKRLVPGFEAPVMISWGRVNREALIRVPRATPGSTSAVRVELRSLDPSCNPYLAFALMLRTGLDGVEKRLPLPAPVEEGLYTLDETTRLRRGVDLLPGTLGEALTAMKADAFVLDALGAQIAEWFVEAKAREWDEYRSYVHPWELDRYLPIY